VFEPPRDAAQAGPRVGYVLKKYPRLSETFVLDEILGLESAGVDVSIYSLRFPDEARFHADLAMVNGMVRYLPPFGSASTMQAFDALRQLGEGSWPSLDRALGFLELLPPERRASLLIQALHLAALAKRDSLDHLHAHFMTVAAHTAYLTHLLTGIPFSVTAHAKDIYRETVDPEVFRHIGLAASAVVTVCEANRTHIREVLRGDGRVELVYNGIPLDRAIANGGARDRGLILAVGRLIEKKGYHVLLEACRILCDRGVDFRCVLVGDGEERGRLLDDQRRLGLEKQVSILGPASRQRILDWMGQARVLAAPCVVGSDGNRDALPTVLLEALAAGLPVVSTPIGGIPEIVDHGVQGLLAREGDPGTLADSLQRLMTDDELWGRASLAGPARVAARFDRDKNLPRLIELFESSSRPALVPARGMP
jgi:colanic acid/amylovoran biosynthesis glycosyltransferase